MGARLCFLKLSASPVPRPRPGIFCGPATRRLWGEHPSPEFLPRPMDAAGAAG